MKLILYCSKQLIAVILTLSLVFAGVPINAGGHSCLAPPGSSIVPHFFLKDTSFEERKKPILKNAKGTLWVDNEHYDEPVPAEFIKESVLYDQRLGSIADEIDGWRKREVVRSWFIYTLSSNYELTRHLSYKSVEILVKMLNSTVEIHRLFFIQKILPDLLYFINCDETYIYKQEEILNALYTRAKRLKSKRRAEIKLLTKKGPGHSDLLNWDFIIEDKGDERIQFYEWISFCLFEQGNDLKPIILKKNAFKRWLKTTWKEYPEHKDGDKIDSPGCKYQYYSIESGGSHWGSGKEGFLLPFAFKFKEFLDRYKNCRDMEEFCAQLFSSDHKCVIVGSGWDGTLCYMAKKNNGNVVAIDTCFRATRICRQIYEVPAKIMDLLHTTFGDEEIDAVLGSSIVYYISDKKALAEELARIIKTNGIISFIEDRHWIDELFVEKLKKAGFRIISPSKYGKQKIGIGADYFLLAQKIGPTQRVTQKDDKKQNIEKSN